MQKKREKKTYESIIIFFSEIIEDFLFWNLFSVPQNKRKKSPHHIVYIYAFSFIGNIFPVLLSFAGISSAEGWLAWTIFM